MHVEEIIPMLRRLCDPETLAKHDSLTPTTLDQLADYADAVQKLAVSIAGGPASAPGNAVAAKILFPAADSASSVDFVNGVFPTVCIIHQ